MSLTEADSRAAGGVGPFADDLADIVEQLAGLDGGVVADYIPELGKADPASFGVAVATIDGAVHEAGDADLPFTIQSISKPFVYGLALEDRGREEVLRRVGAEPTGDAFNSIEIDEATLRPYNPMVNAGAIVTAGMVAGVDPGERLSRVIGFLSDFAGRPLEVDEEVFRSERDTGDRNRAIAYFMRAHGMLDDVESVLDLYFRQCSALVTCRDLAVMAATLANGGVNPCTGKHALHPDHVESVLSVMATCGMYDFAGEWLYRVGLPAKSGVAGGIIAVLPGQLGIGVFSPPLDERGNSVRGIAACQELSRRFHLHEYRPGLISTDAVLRRYDGGAVRARRTRGPHEEAVLDREGRRIAVFELGGDVSFASAERLTRTVLGDARGADLVVLDFRRVSGVDEAAATLVGRLAGDLAASGVRLIVSHAPASLADVEAAVDMDEALERCEDALLEEALGPPAADVVPLRDQALLRGLDASIVAAVERATVAVALEPGEVLFWEGDAARDVFFVCSGALRAEVDPGNGTPPRRLVSMGPGTVLGEIALLDGGTRSATVVAEDRSLVRRLSFDEIARLGEKHQGFTVALYRNLGRLLALRVRRVTGHVRALER